MAFDDKLRPYRADEAYIKLGATSPRALEAGAKRGKFPRPMKLGGQNYWNDQMIERFIQERRCEADAETKKRLRTRGAVRAPKQRSVLREKVRPGLWRNYQIPENNGPLEGYPANGSGLGRVISISRSHN
jgi:hypothetical protein